MIRLKQIARAFILLTIALFLSSCSTDTATDYQKSIRELQEITLTDVEKKLHKQESFYLYSGRETCPYCQEFAPKLAQATKETQINVYYLNSEKLKKEEWRNFKATVGFRTIPNLTYFSQGQAIDRLQKGSQASVEEIKEFIGGDDE